MPPESEARRPRIRRDPPHPTPAGAAGRPASRPVEDRILLAVLAAAAALLVLSESIWELIPSP